MERWRDTIDNVSPEETAHRYSLRLAIAEDR